jgi:hypothetical protein
MVPQSELDAEGDRVGLDFRLGQRTGAWSARRYSGSFGCGMTLAVMLALATFLLFLPYPAPGRTIAILSYLALAALAALMLAVPSRTWKERLFVYAGGIAQFTGRESEPAVLRWPDLATVSVQVVTGYEGDSLSSCVLRDRAGTTLTVENRYGDACDRILVLADRALAARLAGTLIARFDAGEPVTFGRLTIDQAGISSPGDGSGKAWSAYWRDTREIEITKWGHRLAVKPARGPDRQVKLDGAPNDLMARYVLWHAAARAGVAVTGDPPDLGQAA